MKRKEPHKDVKTTSWEPVGKWYQGAVGDEGLYYHKQIIIPGVVRLLGFSKDKKQGLLDLACGQGILARHVPESVSYVGIDISPTLVKDAKKRDLNSTHEYHVSDVTKPLPIKGSVFTHASIILAIQNIEHPNLVFKNSAKHLEMGGKLIVVMNHPCFRIPRQSSWQVDDSKKLQYRRIDRYYSPLHIPIQAHPSKGEQSSQTWSFHYPLSSYTKWLHEAGFVIETIEEWCSDKASIGANAKMENRSREEFPLFLTLCAIKAI